MFKGGIHFQKEDVKAQPEPSTLLSEAVQGAGASAADPRVHPGHCSEQGVSLSAWVTTSNVVDQLFLPVTKEDVYPGTD